MENPFKKNDNELSKDKQEIESIEINESKVNGVLAIDRSKDENDSRFHTNYASTKKILEAEKDAIVNGTADLNNLKYLSAFLSKKFNSHEGAFSITGNVYTKSYVIKDGKVYVLLDHVDSGASGEQDRDNYIVITDKKLEKIGETEKIQYYLTKPKKRGLTGNTWDSVPMDDIIDNPCLKRIVEVSNDSIKVENKNGDIIDLKIK